VCTPEHSSRSSVHTVVTDSLQSSHAVGLLSRGHFHRGSGLLVHHSPKLILRSAGVFPTMTSLRPNMVVPTKHPLMSFDPASEFDPASTPTRSLQPTDQS